MLEEMLGGARPAEPETPRRAPPSSEQQAAPDGRQRNPYEDIFGRMFETGRQQREDYEKSIGSVFDQFLRGMDRNR
ncbi:MAG: hypothetical protein DIU65_12200 [Proteobacteria bacterium]|nr:MAG: hypothetical protein DIU65_12200 [Pseudomonadota bacterium]